MTEDQIKHTYEIAEKHDVYLYSDEIYARMIYDNTKFNSPSIYDKCKDRTIISNGFSKAFAMTGWRLGAIIGPSVVIEKMKLLLETTSSCVSPFIQKAGIEAISGDQSRTINMYKEYNERRELIVDGLNSITSISCVKPSGAFYVFPNIKNTGMTSIEFANYILDDANVAVLPGTNFGEYGEGYVRLCYATTKEKINEAIKRIDLSMRKLNL
jgi:aspartate/methionine/tyrosine aminotransferase